MDLQAGISFLLWLDAIGDVLAECLPKYLATWPYSGDKI